jgi:hypothetical protein
MRIKHMFLYFWSFDLVYILYIYFLTVLPQQSPASVAWNITDVAVLLVRKCDYVSRVLKS